MASDTLDNLLKQCREGYFQHSGASLDDQQAYHRSAFLEVMTSGAPEVPTPETCQDWLTVLPFCERLNMVNSALALSTSLLVSLYWSALASYRENPKVAELFSSDHHEELYFGAFALTEWGHGTTIAELELTATMQSDGDFVISDHGNPRAHKFWIGNGTRAYNAAVVCRVIDTKGIDRGIYPFLLRLRDHSGSLLEGVEVFDIGPKWGLNNLQNACMSFRDVRYSADCLLGELSDASSTREMFHRLNDVLCSARVGIAFMCLGGLKRSLAEVVSYAKWRETFKGERQETRTLYQLDGYRQRLCAAFLRVYGLDSLARRTIAHNERDELACDILKLTSTDTASDTMLEFKRLTGGYGFSGYSCLGEFHSASIGAATGEGDNWPLAMRILRILIDSKPGSYFAKGFRRTEFGLARARLALLRSPGNLAKEQAFAEAAQNVAVTYSSECMERSLRLDGADPEILAAFRTVVFRGRWPRASQVPAVMQLLETTLKRWEVPVVGNPDDYFVRVREQGTPVREGGTGTATLAVSCSGKRE